MTSFLNSWFSSNKESEEPPTQSVPTNAFNAPNFGPNVDNYQHMYPQSGVNSNMNRDGNQHPPPNYYRQGNIKDAGALSGPLSYLPATRPGQNVYPEIQPHLAAAARHPSQPQLESDPWNWSLDGTQENAVQQPHHVPQNRSYFTPHTDAQHSQLPVTNNSRFQPPPLQTNPNVGLSHVYPSSNLDPHRPPANYNEQNSGAYYSPSPGQYGVPSSNVLTSAGGSNAMGPPTGPARQEAFSPNYYNQDYMGGPPQLGYEAVQGIITSGPVIQQTEAVPFTVPTAELKEPEATAYDDWNRAWTDTASPQLEVVQRKVDHSSPYADEQANDISLPFVAQLERSNPQVWSQPPPENLLQQKPTVERNELNPNAPIYYPTEEPRSFEQNTWGYSGYPPNHNVNTAPSENVANKQTSDARQPSEERNVPFQRETQGYDQHSWGFQSGFQPPPTSNAFQQEIHPLDVAKNKEIRHNENAQAESLAVKQTPLGSSPRNSPRLNVEVVQQEPNRDRPASNNLSGQEVPQAQDIAQEYTQPVHQPSQSNNQTELSGNFQTRMTDSLPVRPNSYEQQTWGYSEHHVQQNINLTQMGIVSTNSHSILDSTTQNYEAQSWGLPQTAAHQNVNIIQTEVRQETTGDGAQNRTALDEEESQDFGSVVSASSIVYGNDDGYNKLGETDNFAYLQSGTTGNKGLAAQWSTESLHSQSSGELRDDENTRHSLSTVNSMCDQVDDLHLTSTTSNEGLRLDSLAASETLSSSSSGVNVGRRYNVAGRQDNAFGPFGHGNELDNLETLPENQERPNSIGEQSATQRIPVGQESSPRQWPSNFPSQPENQELAGRCNPDRNQYLETGQLPDDEPGMERMIPGAGNEGEPLRSQRMVPGSGNEGEERNQRMVPGARNEEEPVRNQRMVPGARNEREPPPGLRRMVPGESSSPETRGLSSQQSGTRLLNGDGEETAPATRTPPDSAVVATSTERSATIGSDTVDTFVQPAAPPTPPPNASRREQPKKRRDDRRHKAADSTDEDRPRRDKNDRERERERERNKPTRKTSRHERDDSDSRRSQESLRAKDARRRRDRDRDRDRDGEPVSGSDAGSERKRRYDRDRYKKEHSRSPERGYRDDRRGPRRPYSTKERPPRDDRDYYSAKDRSRDEYKSRRSEHRDTASEYSDYDRRELDHSRGHYRHEPSRRDGKPKYRGDPRYANSYRGEEDWRFAANQRHSQYYDRYEHNGYHRPESREQHVEQRMFFQYMSEEELMSKLAYYAAAPISNESVDYFNAVRGLPWSTKAHHNWFYYKFTPWLKMQETSNSYRDDGRGSVHSGRSSENKQYQDISSGVRSSTPQRLTPTLYSTAHVRGILSAQGSLVKVAPHYPLDGQPATVFLSPMQGHTFDKPTRDQMKIFPGPLIRGKTHKQTLISFCNQKIATLQQKDLDDDHILIWQLLILLIKQNGMVVGTDISELLLGNEQTAAPSPSPSTGSRRSSESASEGVHHSAVARFNVKSEEELTKTFRNFLLCGNDNEALEWAMSNNLWGHAFFLGSKMDNRTNAKVMARFANGLPYNDPLQTFYQLKSGRQPAAVTGCVDEKWGNWRPHLAMMMANSGSSELDYKSLMTLGDSLGSRGSLYASHFIYIMAQVDFMPYAQRGSAKLVLLGSSHVKPYAEFATNEAIQLTEIYEYASKLREGNEAFCIPSFQWFKLVYAERLVEAGFQLEALLYLEQVAGHVQHQPGLYDTGFLSRVHRLGDRLKYADPLLKDAPAGDREQLAWLTMLEDLVRSRAAGQVSGIQPTYPSQTYRQESTDSNFNQPPTDQPQSYSHDTYADPIEPRSLSYAPAEGNASYDKSTAYAPSYDKAAAEVRAEEQSYQYQPQSAPVDSMDSAAVPNYAEHWQPSQQWQAAEQPDSTGGYDHHQSNTGVPAKTQESNDLYDPSSHQMYQPNQWNANDVNNSRAENEDEPPEPADPMPPPPQISLPNAYSPRERQNSESNGKAPGAVAGAGSAAKPPKPTDNKSKSNPGWFGGILHKLSLKPKNQMILPEDKNPTIVWDPVKKRWIDTEADGDEVTGSFAPPPKASEMPGFNAIGSMGSNHNSMSANAMEPKMPSINQSVNQSMNSNLGMNTSMNPDPNSNMQSSAPSTQAPLSNMPPPASASLNGYKPNRKGKNFRSNYVDIFKGTGSLTPTPAAPPGLFDMAPQSNVKIFTPYGAGGGSAPVTDASTGAYGTQGLGETQQMSRWSSASSLSREVQSYTMRGQRHSAKTPQPSSGSTQMYAHQGYGQPNASLGYNRI